jgi:hypothetical protein
MVGGSRRDIVENGNRVTIYLNLHILLGPDIRDRTWFLRTQLHFSRKYLYYTYMQNSLHKMYNIPWTCPESSERGIFMSWGHVSYGALLCRKPLSLCFASCCVFRICMNFWPSTQHWIKLTIQEYVFRSFIITTCFDPSGPSSGDHMYVSKCNDTFGLLMIYARLHWTDRRRLSTHQTTNEIQNLKKQPALNSNLA